MSWKRSGACACAASPDVSGHTWLFFIPPAEVGYRATIGLFLIVSGAMALMADAARRMREGSHHALLQHTGDRALRRAACLLGQDGGFRPGCQPVITRDLCAERLVRAMSQ